MVFLFDDFCDTTCCLVDTIESDSIDIVSLFIMPIVIDLRENTVV